MKKIILLFVVLSVFSCSLKRSNPLDPHGHDIYIPANIKDFQIIGEWVESGNYVKSYNNTVRMEWSPNEDEIEGYYIYRSRSYNGLYTRVKTVYAPNHEWADTESSGIEPNNWYYYKISAFNEQGLEGYRSEWKQTWVVGD
ncbi:MAG: hypothetical protein DRZ79_00330 [Candidatus Cloacimonadota bacterium]|nr:MAG: hypothetical protein DRZ79_00330 [Candidatus Cloacimonadota bacterium]